MILSIFGLPVVIIKNNNINTLFSNELHDEVMKHLMLPENKDVSHPYARGGRVCSTDLNFTLTSDKAKQFNILLDTLKQTGIKYANLYSDATDLQFDNMWINLTYAGCETRNHWDRYTEEDEKTLIMLFYPKAPLGGSNLVFIHNSNYGDWPSEYQDSDVLRLAIEEGDIVIMDNTILHAVDAHMPSEPRMCIATEFKFV